MLIACRVMLGVGEAFNWPCAVTTIRRVIPRESRGLANGIFHSGASVGAVVTPFLVLLLVDPDTGQGWRQLFVIVGGVGAAWALLWAWNTRGERGILPYVWDLDWLLRECARVLRSGGQMVVGVPNMRAWWRLWSLAGRGRFPRTSHDPVGYDGGSVHYFCRRNLVELLGRHQLATIGAHGVFCVPRALEPLPDGGPTGWLKREFLGAEVVVDARKTGA